MCTSRVAVLDERTCWKRDIAFLLRYTAICACAKARWSVAGVIGDVAIEGEKWQCRVLVSGMLVGLDWTIWTITDVAASAQWFHGFVWCKGRRQNQLRRLHLYHACILVAAALNHEDGTGGGGENCCVGLVSGVDGGLRL